MKKSELVSALATKMEITKKAAAEKIADVNTIIEVIAAGLEVGDKAKIGDFIVVEKKEVAARTCRNPKTGEEIVVPAKVALKVKHTSAVKNIEL